MISGFRERLGKFEDLKIFKNENGGVFGFVRLCTTDDARDAIKWLNTWFLDRKVSMDWANYDLKNIKDYYVRHRHTDLSRT